MSIYPVRHDWMILVRVKDHGDLWADRRGKRWQIVRVLNGPDIVLPTKERARKFARKTLGPPGNHPLWRVVPQIHAADLVKEGPPR